MLNALTLLFLSATANAASLSLAKPLRLRGGRAPADLGQAIMLTSGSLVTLGGAKVVVDGQGACQTSLTLRKFDGASLPQ